MKWLPLVLLLTGCSYFGTNSKVLNEELLVEEYQGYADYWGNGEYEHVVLCNTDVEVINFSDGSCLIILPAPFSFDQLWEAESKCNM